MVILGFCAECHSSRGPVYWGKVIGLGRIIVLSTDKDTPLLSVGPIYNARDLYSRLKKAQLDADRRRGVLHIDH